MTMQHKLKSRLFLTVFLIILGLIIYELYYKDKSKGLTSVSVSNLEAKNEELLPVFIKAGEVLQDIWENAQYPNISDQITECDEFHWELSKAGRDYLKCNPQLFQCYFSNQITNAKKTIDINYNDKQYELEILGEFPPIEIFSRKNRFYKRMDDGSIQIALRIKGKTGKFYLNLPSFCNETYLPKGEYAHSQKLFGTESDQKNRDPLKIWKNETDVFIDQFLVTNREVFEWRTHTGNKNQNKNIFDWYEYSHDLTLKEMKDYCFFRGKKLLTSRAYDAASFYRDDSNPEKRTSLFAWGDRNQGLISPRADFNDYYEKSLEIDAKTCKKIPIEECGQKIKSFETNNVSWLGFHDVMGGYLEALDNQEAPFFNIKASSYYFDKFSPWHILSHRFHWNGRGFQEKDFVFESSLLGERGDPISVDDIKVGFRCMRELK